MVYVPWKWRVTIMAALKRINQDDLRTHNLSVVINTLLRSSEPLSRADLAKETGLTKATMSLLTSMLLEHRILKEGVPSVQSVYGRPSTPLSINGGAVCGIGVQINTDGYGYMVLDLDGTVVAERWISKNLQTADATAIFGDLDTMLSDQISTLQSRGYTISGAGLALPGLVANRTELLGARNLGWERLDLMQFPVVERLNMIAGNEANMAAIAQLPGYAAYRRDDCLVGANSSFIYVSTDIGIGGALVRDGRVIVGDHGFAGEIGHLAVEMDGPVCRCGRHGCLEVYAGRRSMIEAAGIASGDESFNIDAVTELFRRLRQGDPQVEAIVDRGMEAMGSALASLINLSDMDTVLIGGMWNLFDDEYLQKLRNGIQRRILSRNIVDVRIMSANTLPRPALYGAALTGLRRFVDDPLQFM